MFKRILLLSCSIGLFALLPGLAACQTPSEPRVWHDEFTDESGLYVHASRRSGGYDLRFATTDARPEHIRLRVRTTRAIHGRTAYFLIDGERHELPIDAKSYQADRSTGSRGAVGAGGGFGGSARSGVHTGVGISLGHSPTRLTTYATIHLPVDFAQKLVEANDVRVRIGDPSGPTYRLDERTRQRITELIDRLPQGRAEDVDS